MSKVISKTAENKAKKPHPDFPLFPHKSGRWAKKVRGQFAYFGKISDDPKGEAALNRWLAEKDDLLAGRKPRGCQGGVTVRDLLNRFMSVKDTALQTGEIGKRTRDEYFRTCERVASLLGKTRALGSIGPEDFESIKAKLPKTWGPSTLIGEINRICILFKFAFDADMVDRPIKFGPGFKRPSQKVLRKHKAKREAASGKLMFEPDQLWRIVEAAGLPLRAMVLLGLQGGFGNNDCASLPCSAIDFKTGWIDFARPKTGIPRKFPMWPETKAALSEWLKKRPEAKEERYAGLVFITRHGDRFSDELSADCAITKGFKKLLDSLGLHRDRLGFYSLRRTFETIGGESGDQIATSFIMGHSPPADDMAAKYRQRVSDERLQKVVDHVRNWFLAGQPKAITAK